MQTFGQILNR